MKKLLLLAFWGLRVFAESSPVPATLEVVGQPLFTFRTRIGSVQPAERVRLISERIARVQGDQRFDLQQIQARAAAEVGWEVLAGDQLLLVITAEDARGEKRPIKLIAEGLALRIRELLEKDRFDKSPANLMRHALIAFGYLVGLVLILWLITFISRRLEAYLDRSKGTRIRSLQLKGFELLSAERITLFARGILRVLRLVVILALLYFFVPLVLSLFPWTEKLSPVLIGYVVNPLRQIGRGVVAFIPNLFFIVLNILVVRYLLKVVRFLFGEIERGNLRFAGFYPEWAQPTYVLVRGLAIAFTVVIIFPYIPGSNSLAFQGVSVFLGILVSLGSTSAVANAVAGIVLTYMRSFRPGELVKIADTTGDVVEKTLFVTRIRTIKNVDVTIPNSLVLNSHIINFSALAATTGLILHTEVTIGYDAPWEKVHALLIQAALATEDVLTEPKPFVLQTALEDSYVRYQLNAYTAKANQMVSIYSNLHAHIQDAFNTAGVEIMSPAYHALRDGNCITVPAAQRPEGYEPPSFRMAPPGDKT